MERTEEIVSVLAMYALWKARKRSQDEKMEVQRRLRRKLMLAARRRRAIQRHQRSRQWIGMMLNEYYSSLMRPTKIWAFPRTGDWWENTAQNFTEDQWLEDFRVSRETFKFICATLRRALQRQDTSYRLCIPLEKRVAIALYKLASTSEYRTVADLFAVSRTSVCRCVHDFCKGVITILRPQLIKTPDQAKLAEMADHIEEKFGIPQCIGAIDGTHIPILKPPQHQSDFHNKKGGHSIILQAVVDGNGMFWDLSVGQPGKENDANVLRKSRLWDWATTSKAFSSRVKRISGTDVGYFILGDLAYPLEKWLLKPYPDTESLTEGQELFNARTNPARCVVDEALGRLKGRWRCLSKRSDCSVNVVADMVETCCTLHNLCESHTDRFLPEWASEEISEDDEQPSCRGGDDSSDVRNALQQLFIQQQGV